MKKTNLFLLLAAAALGVVAFSAKLPATDATSSSPGAISCCGGMALMTSISESSTNVVPDLLKTCPVSGDKLGGDMGKPYVIVYKGQEVKFCCPMCKKDFDKDPEKYMKLIRAADKKDGKDAKN